MDEFKFEQLDARLFDILTELGNISAGNATTAMAQLLQRRIDMSVPKVELLPLNQLSDSMGGPESLVVGILFTLSDDLNGYMMFMLEQASARNLLNLLLGKTCKVEEEFSDFDCSALKEIGNIITGAYLSSLSTMTNMRIGASVPYFSNDMAGAILSVPAIECGKLGDYALIMESQFTEDMKAINGYFILIPTEESYHAILSSLGV